MSDLIDDKVLSKALQNLNKMLPNCDLVGFLENQLLRTKPAKDCFSDEFDQMIVDRRAYSIICQSIKSKVQKGSKDKAIKLAEFLLEEFDQLSPEDQESAKTLCEELGVQSERIKEYKKSVF